MIAGVPMVGGMGDATARVAEIQSRIESLTAAFAPAPGFSLEGAGESSPSRSSGASLASLGANAAPGANGLLASAVGGVQRTQPEGAWVQHLPEHGRQHAADIDAAAREAGVDPALLAAVVRHESNFDQSTVSHAGAIGLAQLMPGTADWLNVDPHDPVQNLRGGATYLREQLDRFGSVDLALAAYNAGPNRVAQAGGIPQIAETQAYVPRVIATYQEWT